MSTSNNIGELRDTLAQITRLLAGDDLDRNDLTGLAEQVRQVVCQNRDGVRACLFHVVAVVKSTGRVEILTDYPDTHASACIFLSKSANPNAYRLCEVDQAHTFHFGHNDSQTRVIRITAERGRDQTRRLVREQEIASRNEALRKGANEVAP